MGDDLKITKVMFRGAKYVMRQRDDAASEACPICGKRIKKTLGDVSRSMAAHMQAKHPGATP